MLEDLEKSVADLSKSVSKLLAAIEPAVIAETPIPATGKSVAVPDILPRSAICDNLQELDTRISHLTRLVDAVFERLDLP